MQHPENDGSYAPTTITEQEIIERAEAIARRSQKRYNLLGYISLSFAESAKCSVNYLCPPQSNAQNQ